ncbi:DUF2783 domain-containing protein [Roseibium sp.]|uniref:DUF2783 domain-containing protein n=1 Tax=Roseibium sp. TaxID=1936156 RepID=UPI003D1106B5
MSSLNTKPNLPDADGFYAELIGAHEGLDAAQSAALNARLVLLLANHIGDRAVLKSALGAAAKPGSVLEGDNS